MVARYFEASLGRFLSVDPSFKARKNPTNPQRWNRYACAADNPIGFFDPDGGDFVAAANPQTKTMTVKVNIVMTGLWRGLHFV